MSLFHRLDRVWGLEDISPCQRLVLVYLAFRVNEATRSCFPSAGRIASDTGMTRRGVQKAIEALANRGIVTVLSSGRGMGRNASNRYRLDFLEIANPVRHSSSSKWRTTVKGMANSATVNGEPSSHEPLNPSRTVQSAGAIAQGALAPRRGNFTVTDETPAERRRRKLLEVADIHGWHPLDGETDDAYVARIDRLNQERQQRLTRVV